MPLPLFLPVTTSPVQAFGEDSEDSSSSEEESESGSDRESNGNGGVGAAQQNTPTGPAPIPAGEAYSGKATGGGLVANSTRKKKEAADAKRNRGDDDEYLDGIISELALDAAAAAAAGGADAEELQTGASSPLALLLRCDPRCLKLDQELRRKFGGGDRANGAAAGEGARGGGGAGRARRPRRGMVARGGNASVSASLTLKRLVVSAPKEDWPKPPSFVGGGLGMKKCEAGAPSYLPQWQLKAHCGAEWFAFERSSSLEQLQVRGDGT